MSSELDSFAADILNRCRTAQVGGLPDGKRSTVENLAVVLVLRDSRYLAGGAFVLSEARSRAAEAAGISPSDLDAWLDAIREELEA